MFLGRLNFILVFICVSQLIFAQNLIGNASLEQRINAAKTYVEDLNYEQAGVEVDDLRYYMKREKIAATPDILELGVSVYMGMNRNDEAILFLKENLISISTDSPLLPQIERYKATAQQFALLGMYEDALNAEEDAMSAASLLLKKKESIYVKTLENQADSLHTIYKIAAPAQSSDIVLSKQQGFGFLFSFIGLLMGVFYYIFRIKRKNAKQIAEYQMKTALAKSDPAIVPFNTLQTINSLEKEDTTASRPILPDLYADEPEVKRIALVVESDISILMYLRSMLSKRFQVEIARTSSEGLEIARSVLPDLIVCSSLPNGFSGVDFSRALKMSSNTEHIPIVLYADSEKNGDIDAEKAMAEKWFVRPAANEIFQNSVNGIFRKIHAQHVHFQRVVHHWFSEKNCQLDNIFLKNVLQIIENNIADPAFTAEDLAQKLQFSKLQFYRKINLMTGKSPSQLIREMRMEKAASLLRMGKMPIHVVSNMVGYDNAASFSFAYKGHFGDEALTMAS